jgi:UDP-arabinose 4-epimerase
MVQWGPFVEGDILQPADLDRAFELYQPKSVIHFAALAYVGESVAQPLVYYQNNVSGLINVLDAMVRHGADTIVFSSSCTVYGIPDTLPIAETAPQRPISPYGRSKMMCEQILAHVAAAHPLRVALLRYFNACGADPDGALSERHDPETHLIPLAVDAASGRGPPLQIFGADYPTKDGTCERDFIHVLDQRISGKDLAAMAGVARENVSRVLSDLRKRGVIEQCSQSYVLKDIRALEREVQH